MIKSDKSNDWGITTVPKRTMLKANTLEKIYLSISQTHIHLTS